MRLLFATNHAYLPQRVGGSEASTHDLILGLKSFGHEAAVSAGLQSGDWIWLRNRLKSRLTGRPVVDERFEGYAVYRGYGAADGLVHVLNHFRPDAVVVQAGRPLQLAQVLSQAGARTVVYLRDVFFDKLGGNIPDGDILFVANSKFTARAFKAFSGLDATVIPPLVRRAAYETKSTREYALFVNPVPLKGVDVVIELARLNPNVPFLFVEGWPLSPAARRALRNKLAALGNVRLVGNQRDMRKVYSSARIALIPSQEHEAWGRIATEAHFSGIPVLASDIGGLPESVGPGGVLVPPDAPIAVWDEQFKSMWRDEQRYRTLAEAALEYSMRPEIKPDTLCQALLDVMRLKA